MTETAKKPDTAPSDTPVYDVVTTTRYLTTIASEHYGNFNLWPYIYEENKAILGHPDRIKPGTRIVVPPLSKYGVNPKNKSDIDKAKKMGKEIYSRKICTPRKKVVTLHRNSEGNHAQGSMSEWLGTGLQNRLHQFESGWNLLHNSGQPPLQQ